MHISMKIPKTMKRHWVYVTFLGKGDKGAGVIDFRSYNGLVAGGRDILARNSG